MSLLNAKTNTVCLVVIQLERRPFFYIVRKADAKQFILNLRKAATLNNSVAILHTEMYVLDHIAKYVNELRLVCWLNSNGITSFSCINAEELYLYYRKAIHSSTPAYCEEWIPAIPASVHISWKQPEIEYLEFFERKYLQEVQDLQQQDEKK